MRTHIPAKVVVTFEHRGDGGLRAYSDDVPGFVLSHADSVAVLDDVKPALEGILSHMFGACPGRGTVALARPAFWTAQRTAATNSYTTRICHPCCLMISVRFLHRLEWERLWLQATSSLSDLVETSDYFERSCLICLHNRIIIRGLIADQQETYVMSLSPTGC
jgi:hypothetical protein